MKRFDYIELAEAPFKNVAHCNDRQTFVMITLIPNSVVIESLFFFWRPNFKLVLYSCICSMTVLCKCHKPYNDTINDMRSNNHCSIGFTQWWRWRGAGLASAPTKVLIWWNSGKNQDRSVQNLWKPLQNHWNLGKLPKHTSKNGAKRAFSCEIGAKITWRRFRRSSTIRS